MIFAVNKLTNSLSHLSLQAVKTSGISSFLLILFLVAFLSSCEKNKPIIIENIDIPLIIKVLSNGESLVEYSYNNANLLTAEKNKFYYNKHSYNDKNLLIKTDLYYDKGLFSSDPNILAASLNRKEWVNPNNTEKGGVVTFEYNADGNLIRTNYYRIPETKSEFSKFEYDKSGRIAKQSLYWDNQLSYYIDYLYNENGNLIKEIKYHISSTGLAELWTTNEYEFDSLQNPYRAFKRLMTPGIYTNKNNILKETYTLHFEVNDPLIEKVKITLNSYEYFENGYPSLVNGTIQYLYK